MKTCVHRSAFDRATERQRVQTPVNTFASWIGSRVEDVMGEIASCMIWVRISFGKAWMGDRVLW